MSSGSTSQPVTTQTTSSAPWAGVQPYLSNVYATADALRANNIGFQPYPGTTVAPLQQNVQAGLQDIFNVGLGQAANANQQTLGGPAAANLVASQGITPGVQAALGGLGQTAGQYGQIYGQSIGATNPYLQAVIDAQNARGNAAIQSSMSAAGRYGSGQYQDVIARAQAQVADPLLMQDYEARQARALQASQGLGQTYGQMAGITQQGLGQSLQALGMIPALQQGMYIPGQMQLASGQYLQDRAQQDLQGQINLWNANQARDWQQVQRESAILSGAGSLGGTTVTAQTPQQQSLAARLAGGALAGGGLGSSFGGPIGGIAGAGLGALAGAFL